MEWLDAQKRIATLMEHFHSESVWALDPELWKACNSYGNVNMVNNCDCGWNESRLPFGNGSRNYTHWAIPRMSDPFYQKYVKFTGRQWREHYMDGKDLIIDSFGNVCTS